MASTLEIHNDREHICYNRYGQQVMHDPNSCQCQPPSSIVEVPAGSPCDLFYISQDGFVHRYDIAHTPEMANRKQRGAAIAQARYRAIRELFDGGLIEMVSWRQYPAVAEIYPLLKHCEDQQYEVYVSEDALVSGKYVRNCFYARVTGHIVIVNANVERQAPKVNSRTLAKYINQQLGLCELDNGMFCIDDGDGKCKHPSVDTVADETEAGPSGEEEETEPIKKKQRL